jgi:hypothetical protein
MRHPNRKRKCPHCKVFFVPDYRNVRHQRYCAKPPCRKASKLQDDCSAQPFPYQSLERDLGAPALQDTCSVQLDVFIGLILI